MTEKIISFLDEASIRRNKNTKRLAKIIDHSTFPHIMYAGNANSIVLKIFVSVKSPTNSTLEFSFIALKLCFRSKTKFNIDIKLIDITFK